MLDDLTIGIEVDLTPFTTGMAEVETRVNSAPTINLTPMASEFNVVTDAMARTAVASTSIDTTSVVGAMETVQASIEGVSTAASNAHFNIGGLGRTFTAVSMATKPLAAVPGQFGLISGAAGLAASAAAHVAAAFGLASTLATHMAVGLSIILAPLRGLVLVPRLIAASFSLMFAVVLAPFRVLGFAAIATAKAMWMLLQPVLKLAAAIFKLKLFFATLRIQLTLVKLFFGALPPKIRLVVGGLIALGAAGRVGAAAASLVGKAMGAMAFAALAVRSPLKAVGFAALKTALTLGRFTRSVVRATKAMLRFAFAKTVAGLKSVGAASLSVAGNIGGRLLGALKSGVVAIGALAVAGAGWGIKLAADAEQAEIAFTTMLKSGDAARAVLGELETFAASTPFQLNDLRDGAKQLLNAQVPASQLTDKLTMLGDIAAGTGKPIGDFVRIFAKVKATGKVSLETLNQLAERGVPIYTALQQQLGMSREKMLEMISKGKVGFTELNGALTATASGAGVFAGGMAAQSQTVSGLFSTLKDNVGFAMRELGTEIIGAFDFKGLMASGITMFQSLKAGIASARPAFIATATVVKAAFGAVWEVVSVTFNGITAALGLTGGNFMSTFMEGAAVATWAFKQWPNIAQLAFTNVGLWLVQVGAEFVHLFTGVLPALFTWFGSNWKDLFFTAFDLVTTVFINLGRNVRNAMTAIWDFIASGGTASLSIAWTPLTEGFANTISELPNIPDRAIGELERNLISQSDSLANALGSSLAAEIDNNMRILDEFQSQTVETPAIPGITADTDAVVDGDGTGDKKKTRTSFAVDSLDRGSEAALKAVFSAGAGDKTPQQQLTVQKQMAASLKTIAAKPVVQFDTAGAVG